MGRTGYMYAWQRYGVKPDIMTTAKALGCGVPVGAFLMTEKVGAHSLTSGDHGTTYGGNPLACAAVSKVLDLFEKDNIIDNVRQVGAYLEEKLAALVDNYDFIEAHRGVGLMQGLVFSIPVGDIISRALEKGLILINAGTNIIRFVPPLVITRENVDDMIVILRDCLDEVKYRSLWQPYCSFCLPDGIKNAPKKEILHEALEKNCSRGSGRGGRRCIDLLWDRKRQAG